MCIRDSFITDIGVHLLPTLILLQQAAHQIGPLAVVLAYLSSRLWSLAVSSHHFGVDWTKLRTHQTIRLIKRPPQPVTAYVDNGVINDIYAFEPPAPVGFFTFAVLLEAVVAATFLALTLVPIGAEIRTQIFMTLGANFIASWETCLLYTSPSPRDS
eukprot:TRINITY_DN8546_c0_g1_i1.p1 TRINITY_DN8546_c0_g1~~TRINITY_DN8546_c0_g1_i1.p1  ORF type:complete len:157 (+),score=35.71 TRINITY_DN8546_c0_g1_i1:117-587(+)